jgi:hypothetical protein
MTNTAKLAEAIRDSGVRSVNFFNGRLLTGDDLRSEQQAGRDARMLLGRAIGPGVAEGLLAEAQGTTGQLMIHVTAGVAINRLGQALMLASDKDLTLVEPPDTSVSGTTGFKVCGEASTGVFVASNGFYVLTIAPAEYSEGRALVSGLATATAACNTKLIVETAQFRLLPLVLTLTSDSAHTRNMAAYAMFGVDALGNAFIDPFANPFAMSAKPPPAPPAITDCDVPLALIQIVAGKLVFVDAWAVRRACAAPGSASRWEALFDDSAARRATAMLYQFQAQLGSEPTSIKATERFRFLPPVGLVPRTFSGFFDDLKVAGPVLLAPASVGPLVQAALRALPIKLDGNEMIWRFEVGNNADDIRNYDVFASRHVIDLLGAAMTMYSPVDL